MRSDNIGAYSDTDDDDADNTAAVVIKVLSRKMKARKVGSFAGDGVVVGLIYLHQYGINYQSL